MEKKQLPAADVLWDEIFTRLETNLEFLIRLSWHESERMQLTGGLYIAIAGYLDSWQPKSLREAMIVSLRNYLRDTGKIVDAHDLDRFLYYLHDQRDSRP